MSIFSVCVDICPRPTLSQKSSYSPKLFYRAYVPGKQTVFDNVVPMDSARTKDRSKLGGFPHGYDERPLTLTCFGMTNYPNDQGGRWAKPIVVWGSILGERINPISTRLKNPCIEILELSLQ